MGQKIGYDSLLIRLPNATHSFLTKNQFEEYKSCQFDFCDRRTSQSFPASFIRGNEQSIDSFFEKHSDGIIKLFTNPHFIDGSNKIFLLGEITMSSNGLTELGKIELDLNVYTFDDDNPVKTVHSEIIEL